MNSDSLVNSGEDASLDSIISASTLVAAIIYLIWNISLEAFLGAIISIIILKSGIEMLQDTISKILGQSTDPKFAREIKKTVCFFPNVYGAYDLIVYDYGPDNRLASIHIEVPNNYTAAKLDELTRKIFDKVYVKHNVALTGISIYALNTADPFTVEAQKEIVEAIMKIEYITIHGFYIDQEKKIIRFDIVISLEAKDRKAIYQKAYSTVQALVLDYTINIVTDTDYAEV